MQITDIVMDFDGTCTEIPVIYEQYLAQYLVELNKRVFSGDPVMVQEWKEAQQLVSTHSPVAAWTVTSTPAAPAAADPYILAYESAKHLLRKKNSPVKDIPFEVHGEASSANPAPWRNEARTVFEKLLKNNINITFISNSGSSTITERLKGLFTVKEIPKGISIKSGAEKFRIAELTWDSKIPADAKKAFQYIPPVLTNTGISRPVYLRRAAYFEAICDAFTNDLGRITTAVFCGDIWEMDLAMPHILGANIHLIERATPFDTYEYEHNAVKDYKRKGKISKNLNGLLDWLG